MHFCCNVVTGPEGSGEAVLIRAVEPLEGEATMRALRKNSIGTTVTNGPSKLCMAMDITRDLNGHNLNQPPIRLIMNPPIDDGTITTTARIGLSKATETLWRFYITNSNYISKKL